MSENVFVRGASDSSLEGMTKEQILAAIVQAVEGGTIENVNTGFVTTIKEQNKGVGLSFWIGTTAEFEALEVKAPNVIYIKTDDTSAADINADITELFNGLQNTPPLNHATSTAAFGLGTSGNYGHVKIHNDETTNPSAVDGVALSGRAGYNLNNKIAGCAKVTFDNSGGAAVEMGANDPAINVTLSTPFTASQLSHWAPLVKMYVDAGVSVPNNFKWTHFCRGDKLIIICDNSAGSSGFTARFKITWIKLDA